MQNGVIRGTLLAYRFMGKDRGGQGGTIVNTASTAFARPQVSTPIYTATNYAVVGLTRSYGVRFCLYFKVQVDFMRFCSGFNWFV